MADITDFDFDPEELVRQGNQKPQSDGGGGEDRARKYKTKKSTGGGQEAQEVVQPDGLR